MRSKRLEGDVDDLARWAQRTSPFPVAFLDGNDGSGQGRFSFLALSPRETVVCAHDAADPLAFLDQLEHERDDADRGGGRAPALPLGRGPGAGVEDREVLPGLSVAALPRWIGALSYDLAWACARDLGLREPPRLARGCEPLAFFHRHDALVVGDHETGALVAVADDDAALARLSAELRVLFDGAPASASIGLLEREPREVHARAIEAALGSIADGDVYQINLARRWSAPIEGRAPARALAAAMRDASPVPFGALLELRGFDGSLELALVARTMERFLRWDRRTGRLETRPIKGTIERFGPRADAQRERALVSDEKERAEHAMIVDLMRNDLGRVAEPGSVEVARAFEVEPYAHLHHLVSTVRATSRPGTTLRDVVLATFPPGSVTGTPKLRAIERIEALERFPRGFYCGAIGYVDRAGGLSLAVAIRTAQLRERELTYFAGGGIVDASVTERELDETELKARVLDEAIAHLSAA